MMTRSSRTTLAATLMGLLAACGGGGGGSSTPTAQMTLYQIGGMVSGLAASGGLLLRNNGGDDLNIDSNGPYKFATALANGASYSVTVVAEPSGQHCVVSHASDTVAGANISDVDVVCATALPPTISGGLDFTFGNNGKVTTDFSGN